jgi:mono/diheme cytochrome c family protein
LKLAGEWQVLVTTRNPGEFDARVPIRFNIGGTSSAGLPDLDVVAAARFWAVTIFGMGLVLALATLSRYGWTLWARRVGTGAGFGAIMIGAALLLSGPDELAGRLLINPVPPDEISISAGQAIYESRCSSCHGPDGRGDGPVGLSLDPPLLDLAVHVPLHLDAQLFTFIRDGIDGTSMAGFGDQLGATEIWNVINFVQTFPAKANG